MSEERKIETTSANPESPAPAVVLDREAYADRLAQASGQPAPETADWLARLMPAKDIAGVKLPGMGMLDPTKPDQYRDFFRDDFASSRRRLASRARAWISLLGAAGDSAEATDLVDEKLRSSNALLEKNEKSIADAVRPLERSYRQLDAFFANAKVRPDDKVDAFVVNANPEKLMDPDDRTSFEQLAKEIQKAYLSFSMRKNYGLLVMPGWWATSRSSTDWRNSATRTSSTS